MVADVDLDERVVATSALEAAEEQLQSLCASHAGTFVTVERRSRALEQSLTDLQSRLKTVEEKIAAAQHAFEQEGENSLAVLSEKHRMRRRTLLQHSSLLELLELPSLMDACTRSALYEEALSIAAFSNTLERRHANAVVDKVIAQIRSRQDDLRQHLLQRLQGSVTMPECLEVVSALRRLNSIDLERQTQINLERIHAAMELQLQVDFLEARDAWLDSMSMQLQPSASEQLLDAIERYRTRVFEVATQFNAIFRANQQANANNIPLSSMSLLSMWTARRVQAFFTLLSIQLAATNDSSTVRDALEAAVFFASSMGRLGADFTPQLEPIFDRRMKEIVTSPWNEGAAQLLETLKICREAGVASPLVSQASISADAVDLPLNQPQPPPRQLMSFPPMARFVNAILSGLNELRRCLLPGIFTDLRTALDDLLVRMHDELGAHGRVVLTPGFKGDAAGLRTAADQYKQVFDKLVDPYLRASLEIAIGNMSEAERFHLILRENQKETEPASEAQEGEEGALKEGEEEEGTVRSREAPESPLENAEPSSATLGQPSEP